MRYKTSKSVDVGYRLLGWEKSQSKMVLQKISNLCTPELIKKLLILLWKSEWLEVEEVRLLLQIRINIHGMTLWSVFDMNLYCYCWFVLVVHGTILIITCFPFPGRGFFTMLPFNFKLFGLLVFSKAFCIHRWFHIYNGL